MASIEKDIDRDWYGRQIWERLMEMWNKESIGRKFNKNKIEVVFGILTFKWIHCRLQVASMFFCSSLLFEFELERWKGEKESEKETKWNKNKKRFRVKKNESEIESAKEIDSERKGKHSRKWKRAKQKEGVKVDVREKCENEAIAKRKKMKMWENKRNKKRMKFGGKP